MVKKRKSTSGKEVKKRGGGGKEGKGRGNNKNVHATSVTASKKSIGPNSAYPTSTKGNQSMFFPG